jgi:glutamate synthase (NADPH/NADH) small chain
MDCGVPFCHSLGCPLGNVIPNWNDFVYHGQWKEAYEYLEATNNFPEITGRLCPAPCETACTLAVNTSPVTIRNLELSIMERAFESGWVVPRVPPVETGKQVAVVGSGPAGLAAAQVLRRLGHTVVVFEKSASVGGLLRLGIPDFKLEKWVLDRRLDQLKQEGIRFETSTNVGEDITAHDLKQSFDAIVLTLGAGQPRDLPVPGRELEGIHQAMDYLVQSNLFVAGAKKKDEIIFAENKRVLVIGGGDTGADCVGTAIRQRARSVAQIQYHDEPPTHGDVLMHWPEPVPELTPNDHDAEGNRRLWGWDTVRFGGEGGRVQHLELQRLRWWQDADGHWQREPAQGTTRRLPAQLVLIAIGYRHPALADVIDRLGLETDRRGNLAANDQDYQTSQAGVYACGDSRRGQSLVVWAIREGRQCAEAVDRALAGHSDLPRI